jgi:catechol 2,3-dioxygenase-like lactoylglutathione lyase family enzyme
MIDRIDHIVINCRDVEETASWYVRVLGLEREDFGPDRRIALKFGRQKLNLRSTGAPNWPTGAVCQSITDWSPTCSVWPVA